MIPFGMIPGGGSSGYQIANAVRFRSAASASFSRTPGVAGNSKLLCSRFRIKRGTLGALQVIASAGTASIDRFYFDSSDRLCLDVLGTTRLVTTAVYRDPSAHYVDVGFQLDVANGTAALRAKILINGTEVGSYSTDTRSSITNTNTNWNAAVVHYIGKDNAGNYFDGVLSEPSLVDGSTSIAYSTTDTNGVPIPSQPSATWGTCGSYLKFNDGTSATTLGYDRSGNGNNWTASGISTTAGVTYDWLTDTPTNNYATLNPLIYITDGTISAANLQHKSATLGTYSSRIGTVAITSPTYFEVNGLWSSGNSCAVGVCNVSSQLFTTNNKYFGQSANDWAVFIEGSNSIKKYTNGVGTALSGSPTGTGSTILQVAVDPTTGKVWFGYSGTWADSGDPAAGTTPAYTGLPSQVFPGLTTTDNSGNAWINFGQRPFTYTPPTGFKALCTANRTYAAPTTSGSFTGNATADGPCVWLGGAPSTMTINGNAVTWGTHADKIAGGFKVRTASASYNASGSNTFSVSVSGNPFGDSTHTPNTAQGNP